MDDKTFFHEGTLQICGSLDADEVLRGCLDFLKNYMPLEFVELSIYDRDFGGVRIISVASDIDLPPMANPVPLSAEARALIETKTGDVVIMHHPEEDAISREMSASMGLDEMSGVVLHLKVKEERLGVLAVFARGLSRFNAEHARLLLLLHDPFAIAMANALRYREVMQLKDLLKDDNRYLRKELHKISGESIVGEKFGLREVMEKVRQVSALDSQVLLLGETGVGKEVIANALHYSSPRLSGPFIRVNCGAIPESLLDSELFGHEKGAFTGAVARKRGRFERADGGTIFLDEIGELPPAAQLRLLRVLQSREIERVGGIEQISVDVRVIAATHRNLEEMVKTGGFREDLWYRLNVFPIIIPPLRHRREDIPALVSHFIERKARQMKITQRPVPESFALERLQGYDWPGNVRELENAVERELIRSQARTPGAPLPFSDFARSVPEQRALAPASKLPEPDEITNIDEVLAMHIRRIMERTGGRIQGNSGAAKLLGVHPSTLRHRLRKLGIPFGRNS